MATMAPRPWWRRHRRWLVALAAVPLAAAILAAWGLWVETWDPVVRRATIALPGAAMRGHTVNLALVSDIHVGSHGMSAARLDRVVDLILAERPDAIVLAGDFVNGEEAGDRAFHPEMLVAPLSRLHAPLGVYAVLGNHDADTAPETVDAALTMAGVRVLDNQAAAVGPIALAGIYDYWVGHHHNRDSYDAARALGGPIVAVAHAPNLARQLPPDVPVLLAGHTHCGQVVLLGLTLDRSLRDGRPFYDPAFRCGLIPWHGHQVVVTAGVGSGSFPLRIGTRPDFWMLRFTGR